MRISGCRPQIRVGIAAHILNGQQAIVSIWRRFRRIPGRERVASRAESRFAA